jgi:hypothetical protein
LETLNILNFDGRSPSYDKVYSGSILVSTLVEVSSSSFVIESNYEKSFIMLFIFTLRPFPLLYCYSIGFGGFFVDTGASAFIGLAKLFFGFCI